MAWRGDIWLFFAVIYTVKEESSKKAPKQIKKAQVVEKCLGREGAYGQYYDGVIEIDPRQDSQDYLDTLIHELLHHYFRELPEDQVLEIATQITAQIWAKNYRKVEK